MAGVLKNGTGKVPHERCRVSYHAERDISGSRKLPRTSLCAPEKGRFSIVQYFMSTYCGGKLSNISN